MGPGTRDRVLLCLFSPMLSSQHHGLLLGCHAFERWMPVGKSFGVAVRAGPGGSTTVDRYFFLAFLLLVTMPLSSLHKASGFFQTGA